MGLTLQHSDITGVILAGGQGSRMDGQDKGLMLFRGKPLVEHILERLQPQVGKILINANRHLDEYRHYGHMVLTDPLSGFQGPLAGIAAAMLFAKTPYILTVPCDAPLVAPQLAQRLWNVMHAQAAELAVAHDGNHLQSMYALLPLALLPDLQEFLSQGRRSPRDWYKRRHMATVDFSDCAEAFKNMNTPFEKYQLESQVPMVGFCAYSGTGKTTLLTRIIPLLKEQGLRIAAVKHTHHVLDLDQPGKDSYRIREAGAQQVVLASHKRIISLQESPRNQQEASLADAIQTISGQHTDLILVEGFKHEAFPKIELHRVALGKPLMFPEDNSIIAIATDNTALSVPNHVTKLDINDPMSIINFILFTILRRS